MDLATSFLPLRQPFAGAMTRPTFAALTTLLAGWICAPRRTIARHGPGRRRRAASRRLSPAVRLRRLVDRPGRTGRLRPVRRGLGDGLFGRGRHAPAPAGREGLRNRDAPRPAALQPRARQLRVGALLDRAGRGRREPTRPGPAVHAAGSLPAVPQESVREEVAAGLPQKDRTDARHAPRRGTARRARRPAPASAGRCGPHGSGDLGPDPEHDRRDRPRRLERAAVRTAAGAPARTERPAPHPGPTAPQPDRDAGCERCWLRRDCPGER